MPHLILQCSANIQPMPEFQALLGELHRAISELTGVAIVNFKSRAMACESFLVGDGSRVHGFAHLDVRLLRGRSIQQKRQIADAALAILRRHFAHAATTLDLQITVDLLDLDADAYRKIAGKGGTG